MLSLRFGSVCGLSDRPFRRGDRGEFQLLNIFWVLLGSVIFAAVLERCLQHGEGADLGIDHLAVLVQYRTVVARRP